MRVSVRGVRVRGVRVRGVSVRGVSMTTETTEEKAGADAELTARAPHRDVGNLVQMTNSNSMNQLENIINNNLQLDRCIGA